MAFKSVFRQIGKPIPRRLFTVMSKIHYIHDFASVEDIQVIKDKDKVSKNI